MNQYGSYFVPDEFANRVVPSVLLKREVYEPKTIEFIRNNCGNGDIVTAGAFIGDFLPALHGALAADAKIWTFEANPVCIFACRRTMDINQLRRVVLIEKALGAAKETLVMRVYDFAKKEAAAAQSRIVRNMTSKRDGFIDVAVERLDDLVPADRPVSILHLDVEGFEREAVKGATSLINRHRPILILEKNYDASPFLKGLITEVAYEFGGRMENNSFFFPITC